MLTCQFNHLKVETIKILGIFFNKYGIDKINITKTVEKVNQSLIIWNDIKLDLIQRITALKTFILSKFWYIANFIPIEEKLVDDLNKKCFKFILNSKREFVKRNTMIGDYNEGGLNMICIKSKLLSIKLKFF